MLCRAGQSRFGKFAHDVVERRKAHHTAAITLQIDAVARFCGGDEAFHGAARVFRHLFHQLVAFRMHRRVVERVFAANDAQEACALLKSLRSQARHFEKFAARSKRAVFGTVVHNVLRQRRAEARHISQQTLAGRVDVDADRVDTALHRLVERFLERTLVNVVLVLSDADGLRVDFDQFGQGSASRRPMLTAPRTVTS